MKAEYLSRISTLLFQARPELAKTHELKFKSCFGAVAGYVHGRIFISCGRFGIALKLPRETLAKVLKERGARHLIYFPKGHIKKDYAIIPSTMINDTLRFKRLLTESIRFVEAAGIGNRPESGRPTSS